MNELAAALERARDGRSASTVAADVRSLVSDPAKLHDVLRNLLENAVNYSPEGAPVRIEASRDGGDAVLRVIDAGPGIPPSDLGRVFERFYRVDKSRAREPGGTGIGLAIVKHLVELLGGTVTAAERTGRRRRVHRAAAARLDGRRAGGSRRGYDALSSRDRIQ